MRADESDEAVTMNCPVGSNDAFQTACSWPTKMASSVLMSPFKRAWKLNSRGDGRETVQSRAVPSLEAEISLVPLGSNDTSLTQFLCPRNSPRSSPLDASQILTVPSEDALAISLSSG